PSRLIAASPRIFSGIHTRGEDFAVRKDCARHLLVEDLGYFDGRVGGTPDHDELFRRIGDDLGYPREAYERIAPVPEMAAIIAFFRRLADEIPWGASLCATALLEEEVVEIAQTVGRALVQHYGVRPEWGGMNYTVHEAIEKEESGETKKTILKHLRTPDDRRAAEDPLGIAVERVTVPGPAGHVLPDLVPRLQHDHLLRREVLARPVLAENERSPGAAGCAAVEPPGRRRETLAPVRHHDVGGGGL